VTTSTQIRGRIAAYNAGSIPEIDAHLTRLTTSWAKVQQPTEKMRGDYQADLDLLLEARQRLARTDAVSSA
jgi:hypothetical protein